MTALPVSPALVGEPRWNPWISWSAVIAGIVVTAALQIALTQLAVGSGLSFYNPIDPAAEGARIAAGTVIAWIVAGLVSVFLGGWVAGRMKRQGTRLEAGVHGALVWSTWAIAGLLLAALSVGALAGGAVSLLGHGVSAAGSVAGGAATAAGAAGGAIAGVAAPSWDAVKQQVEGAFQSADDSTAPAGSADGALDGRFADRSRLMQLLGHSFSKAGDPAMPAADVAEMNTLLAAQLGIPAQAASNATKQWQAAWTESRDRYDAAKADAERTALEAAAVAKQRTAQAAMIAFGVMLIGLIVAVAGALSGSAALGTRSVNDVPARDQTLPAYT